MSSTPEQMAERLGITMLNRPDGRHGKTVRMLLAAMCDLEEGKRVSLVGASLSHANQMRSTMYQWAEKLGWDDARARIKVETYNGDVRGQYPCRVFKDHYTYEQEAIYIRGQIARLQRELEDARAAAEEKDGIISRTQALALQWARSASQTTRINGQRLWEVCAGDLLAKSYTGEPQENAE